MHVYFSVSSDTTGVLCRVCSRFPSRRKERKKERNDSCIDQLTDWRKCARDSYSVIRFRLRSPLVAAANGSSLQELQHEHSNLGLDLPQTAWKKDNVFW